VPGDAEGRLAGDPAEDAPALAVLLGPARERREELAGRIRSAGAARAISGEGGVVPRSAMAFRREVGERFLSGSRKAGRGLQRSESRMRDIERVHARTITLADLLERGFAETILLW
jgi:hypothetical protein